MIQPALPADEGERLAALQRLHILDTPPEERFDRITRLALRALDVPIAVVSLVDATRQWFKSCQGLDLTETERGLSLCAHAILADVPLIIPDTARDPRSCLNPLMLGPGAIRFYAGQPLHGPGGHLLGTLCVMDRQPRDFDLANQETLRDLALLAEQELNQLQAALVLEQAITIMSRGVVIADAGQPDLPIVYVNPAFERLTGYSAAEAYGLNCRFLQNDDRQQATLDELRAALHTGREARVVLRNYRKDGSLFWNELYVAPVTDAGGVITHFVGVQEDITARQQADDEYDLLLMATQAIAEADDLEAALTAVLAHICAATGWAYGEAWLPSPDETELHASPAWYGIAPALAAFRSASLALRLPPGVELPGRTWVARRPEWIADVSQEQSPVFLRAAAARAAGIKAGLSIPICAGEQVLAVLGFFLFEARNEDCHAVEIVSAVAAQLGALIQRKRAEETARELNASLERRVVERTAELRAIFDAFPDLFFRLDSEGVVMTSQAGNSTALSTPPETFIGRRIADILPPAAAEQFSAALDQLRRGGALVAAEYTLDLHDEARAFEMRLVPLAGGHIVVVVRDITPRKRAQAALQQANEELERRVIERTEALLVANRQLQQEIAERRQAEHALEAERAMLTRRVAERTADLSAANAQLARAARLKDEFLANMSHELRTPLHAILGLSEALQEEIYGPLSPKQRKSVDGVAESGRHLLSLINDILDLSKIEAGRMIMEVGPVEVEALCQASLRLIKQAAHNRQLSVALTIDSAVTTVHADARRLKQVLVNLLSNAVKFTPVGGAIGLEVYADPDQAALCFTVWDRGIGIAATDLTRLFEPFVQLDSRLSRQYEGTGLGLALVARMVALHGGSVTVESTLGQGSRFTVALPWHPTPANAETHSLSGDGTARRFQHALVVEDSPIAAEQLARYLQDLHIRASVHLRGDDVLQQALELQPDIIFLDILLPAQSGWDVLAQLKANQRTRSIAVVVVSVLDEPTQAQTLGAAGMLLKPIDPLQLRAMLERLSRTGEQLPVPAQVAEDRPLVLIVEDNEANITTLSDYLVAKGYAVTAVRTGWEAIQQATERQPAMILMDIQMPGMDGLEATRRIRANSALADTPIIAVTALAMPGDRERCLAAGADDYLSKPIRMSDLTRKIAEQIETRRKRSPWISQDQS